MKTIILSSLIACALHLHAATPTHLAKINKFFEITQMQKQYETSMTAGFSAALGPQLDNLSEEDRAVLDASMKRVKDVVLREMGWSKVKSQMGELYAKHFTEEEIEKIIKLLDNDTGRMLSTKQIALLPDSMAFAQTKMRELAPMIMAAMQDEPMEATETSKSVMCVNNLKQIGLAFKVWAIDNNDEFPFHAKTNKGGTFELCERLADGSDRAARYHFQVMSNELSTPKILVCPEDPEKKAAQNFSTLQATNVSYLVFTGTNVTELNPTELLARCPIHGHFLRCDGSVQKGE